MISWWSKHVGVILSVLMCDIWINVSLQTSALVRPLHLCICIFVFLFHFAPFHCYWTSFLLFSIFCNAIVTHTKHHRTKRSCFMTRCMRLHVSLALQCLAIRIQHILNLDSPEDRSLPPCYAFFYCLIVIDVSKTLLSFEKLLVTS
jgi:hypothetical protein